MPVLNLIYSDTVNDLMCMPLTKHNHIKICAQLIYRLDYAMWVLFSVSARTRKRLVKKQWRHDAVVELLNHFTFTTCIDHVKQCQSGKLNTLPRGVFAALYMEGVRIEHALFKALKDFNVNSSPFAVRFRSHELVHGEFIGCNCENEGCGCKELWSKNLRYRSTVHLDHYFARDLVNEHSLFDLCVQCAATADDAEIAVLSNCLRRQGVRVTSTQDTRIALITMWIFEHARNPAIHHGRPPTLCVRKHQKRNLLFAGNKTPQRGVAAFGKYTQIVFCVPLMWVCVVAACAGYTEEDGLCIPKIQQTSKFILA